MYVLKFGMAVHGHRKPGGQGTTAFSNLRKIWANLKLFRHSF